MSSTVVETKRESQAGEAVEADGVGTPGPKGRVPEFRDSLGDHPLWQAFLDEMEANRQADIAEANRLADLELEK